MDSNHRRHPRPRIINTKRGRAWRHAVFASATLCAAMCLVTPVHAVVVEEWPMDDGTMLHTRIYAPSDALTIPRGVLLVRTPYGAASAGEGHAFDLIRTDAQVVNDFGFVYVTQDVRGTGASAGGPAVRFIDDAPDTRTTIAAITASSWSNGKVAMWGPSAVGIASVLAMQDPPPGLVGVMPLIATGDVRDAFYQDGALREEMAAGWLPDNAGEGILDVIRGEEIDSAFWDEGRLSDAEIASSSVKTLFISGMFDVFGRGGVRTHQRLRALSQNSDEHFLVLGPWSHDSVLPANGADLAGALVGDFKLPLGAFVFFGQPIDPLTHFQAFLSWTLNENAAPNFARVRTWWFTLLDAPEPFTNVRVQGGWVGFDAWPPPDSVDKRYYFYDNGSVGDVPDPLGGGFQIVADPNNPVPTIGGARLITTGGVVNRSGPRSQNPLLDRTDVLLFETAKATTMVEIAGNVRAEIWASSSSTDIDVHVKVMQKTNDGLYVLLADGVRRGRFVDDEDAITPLEPGTPVRFDVDLGPLAVRVRPGHAIAVLLQTSNADRFDVNPNVAVKMTSAPSPIRAALTVLSDDTHPSALILPIRADGFPSSPFPEVHNEAKDPLWPDESANDAGVDDGGPFNNDDGGDTDDDDDDDDDDMGDDDDDDGATGVGCACVMARAERVSSLATLGIVALLCGRRRPTIRSSGSARD